MADNMQKGNRKVTEQDFEKIRQLLAGKVPDNKVVYLMNKIQVFNDTIDLGDSPYNRPTFAKIVMLAAIIFSIGFFFIYPIYQYNFTDNTTTAQKEKLIEIRNRQPNENLGLNITIEELNNGERIVKVYDYHEKHLLAKGDLIGNKSFVLAKNINKDEIYTKNLEIINTTEADINEDVKQEVLSIKENNYNIESSYKDFKSVDYGVDQIINLSN